MRGSVLCFFHCCMRYKCFTSFFVSDNDCELVCVCQGHCQEVKTFRAWPRPVGGSGGPGGTMLPGEHCVFILAAKCTIFMQFETETVSLKTARGVQGPDV